MVLYVIVPSHDGKANEAAGLPTMNDESDSNATRSVRLVLEGRLVQIAESLHVAVGFEADLMAWNVLQRPRRSAGWALAAATWRRLAVGPGVEHGRDTRNSLARCCRSLSTSGGLRCGWSLLGRRGLLSWRLGLLRALVRVLAAITFDGAVLLGGGWL
jgi:hypothetical protein